MAVQVALPSIMSFFGSLQEQTRLEDEKPGCLTVQKTLCYFVYQKVSNVLNTKMGSYSAKWFNLLFFMIIKSRVGLIEPDINTQSQHKYK